MVKQKSNTGDEYYSARRRELEGRKQPSKVSKHPLVNFVEDSKGEKHPVYREEP